MIYTIIFLHLIFQRLFELVLAKSNEKHQKRLGAIEIKDPFYPLIVLVHILFLSSLMIEAVIRHDLAADLSIVLLILFFLLQMLRIWLIVSMGRFWNTKVIIRPGVNLVNRGLFRIVNHPNYWIVFLEMIIIPLLFQAYVTAILFPIFHVLLMTKRIPLENKALKKYSR